MVEKFGSASARPTVLERVPQAEAPLPTLVLAWKKDEVLQTQSQSQNQPTDLEVRNTLVKAFSSDG